MHGNMNVKLQEFFAMEFVSITLSVFLCTKMGMC
jgi:hypothetical protein